MIQLKLKIVSSSYFITLHRHRPLYYAYVILAPYLSSLCAWQGVSGVFFTPLSYLLLSHLIPFKLHRNILKKIFVFFFFSFFLFRKLSLKIISWVLVVQKNLLHFCSFLRNACWFYSLRPHSFLIADNCRMRNRELS